MELRAARTLVAFCALVSFVYGTDTVLFIAASEEKLGTGPEGFGYLLAGLGIGGLIAAPVIDRLRVAPALADHHPRGGGLLPAHGAPRWCTSLGRVRATGPPRRIDAHRRRPRHRRAPASRPAISSRAYSASSSRSCWARSRSAPSSHRRSSTRSASTRAVRHGVRPLRPRPDRLPLARRDRPRGRRARGRAGPRVAVLEQLGFFARRRGRSSSGSPASPRRRLRRPGPRSSARRPAEALYVLAKGEVEVTARGEAGEEQPIRDMTAPCYFGEIGVLEGIPRTATVTASTDVRL